MSGRMSVGVIGVSDVLFCLKHCLEFFDGILESILLFFEERVVFRNV